MSKYQQEIRYPQVRLEYVPNQMNYWLEIQKDANKNFGILHYIRVHHPEEMDRTCVIFLRFQ